MRTLFIIVLIAIPLTGFAHSGRTDANGCHTNHQTGEYHCHNEGVAVKEVKTESRAVARISARDYNCADFTTHAEAQETFERVGGPAIDLYDLDRDKDGLACEDLI